MQSTSILLDSTADMSLINLMASVVRFVRVNSSEVQIKKSFLNFLPLHGKNTKDITKSILSKLQENVLDVMMCRGQAYTAMLPQYLESILEYKSK